jgi:4-carboxymuconolactone decarboxylase
MKALVARDAALVRAALAIPHGDDPELMARFAAAREEGTPTLWLDELTLMTVLFVGFPRALVAARMLRRLEPVVPSENGAAYDRWKDWEARGEATCRAVYADHYDKLRAHVQELHPALDAWVIVDGYGRTMGRSGLDMVRRELCAVALLIPQRVPRQLHSHLRGALNVGASREQVGAALALAADDALILKRHAADARRLFQDILAKQGSGQGAPPSPPRLPPSVT